MSGLRHRRLWLSIGFGLVAFVIYQSLTSHPIETVELGGVGSGHFIAYFTLTFWFCLIFRGWRAGLVIAVIFTAMGVGLEYVQGMTTYRTFDFLDMRDNAIGVAVGLGIASTPLGMALARLERWMGA